MKTTKIAQYAALAANSSCLAALVNILIAALKSKVKTINTPTALNVSLLLISTAPMEPTPFDLFADVLLLDEDSGLSVSAAVLVR